MNCKIIDCKSIARKIRQQLAAQVAQSKTQPKLCVLLVGDDKASQLYVKKKQEACDEVGIQIEILKLPVDSDQDEIIEIINQWNNLKQVHGIIVQLPLPVHLNNTTILNCINPYKDVDCFNAKNIGLLVQDCPNFFPCTPSAVCNLIDHEGIDVFGKHIVIINDSIVVGRPLTMMLRNRGATVTMCNQHTEKIKEISRFADILIVAVGKRPNFVVTEDFCKDNVIIIDVGINKLDKVVGDVDEKSVMNKASFLTKVPGGIGVLTVSMLLKNVVIAMEFCQLPRPASNADLII
jgi:methylenetetrahydrofolate dehydrogenase (NADP+)/methenyltetrahydrofolate cyclohydrolase